MGIKCRDLLKMGTVWIYACGLKVGFVITTLKFFILFEK